MASADAGAGEAADHVLALGADVPDIGAEADREADRDDDQRRRLDAEVLPLAGVDQRLEEDLADRAEAVVAEQREDERADDHGQEHRDQRGQVDHRRAGSLRFSSSMSMAGLRVEVGGGDVGAVVGLAVDAAHQQADLLDRDRRRSARFGDSRPSLITASVSQSASSSSRSWLMTTIAEPRGGEVDQRLVDRRGGAGVDAPGRLRDDQHLGLLQDLAAHDELLQVAARERPGRRGRARSP